MWESLFREIDGWLSMEEAVALHNAAQSCDGVAVEIGSYKGKSTVAIASGLNGTLYAIDPHTGNVEHRNVGHSDTYEEFLRNTKDYRNIMPLRMTSHEGRRFVADNSVGLLFIDGSHEYTDVIKDISDWIPTLRDEATVAFNDYEWPGVYRALMETIAVRNGPLSHPHFVRGSLFMRKGQLSNHYTLRIKLWLCNQIHHLKLVMPRRLLLLLRYGAERIRRASSREPQAVC